MQNYISTIRQKLGNDLFIHPAARIIIENEAGEILFIRRKDTNKIGLPAGGLELNETIEACIRREVLEETGLQLQEVTVIGISSQPKRETVSYPNGDRIQYFTVEFFSANWTGECRADDQETIQVEFLPGSWQQQLPTNEQSAFESLAYYKKTGKIRLA